MLRFDSLRKIEVDWILEKCRTFFPSCFSIKLSKRRQTPGENCSFHFGSRTKRRLLVGDTSFSPVTSDCSFERFPRLSRVFSTVGPHVLPAGIWPLIFYLIFSPKNCPNGSRRDVLSTPTPRYKEGPQLKSKFARIERLKLSFLPRYRVEYENKRFRGNLRTKLILVPINLKTFNRGFPFFKIWVVILDWSRWLSWKSPLYPWICVKTGRILVAKNVFKYKFS